MAASKIKVKINNMDDTRVWRYSEEEDFEALQSFISTSWQIDDFIAQYKDDEDDLITIATPQDLKDAFECARDESKKSLKIYVHQKREPDLTVPTNAPQEAPEEKTEAAEPKEFNSMREMIVDFLTNETILGKLSQFFGALIANVTVAVKAKSGQTLKPADISTMLRAELEKEEYQCITAHPLYTKFGGMAIPYIAHKIAAQQSLYPHFRTETIQQWVQQLIVILQQVVQQTSTSGGTGCSFKDVVIDIEYPAVTDTGKVIHFGVECDLCGVYPVIGDRYKCSMCEDWDCCPACEPQHDHPLIKFKKASKNHKNASFKGLTEIVRQLSGDAAPIPAEEQKAEPDVVSNIMDDISGINIGDDDVSGDAPDCICGSKMEGVHGGSVYDGCIVVFCDGCNKKCWNGKFYHCPNGKDAVHHANGYDLCPKCGKEKIDQDRRVEEQLLADAMKLKEQQQESPVVVEEVEEVVVDEFVYAAQLTQIKTIMALQSGDQDENIKTLLVQHKGDISRVVPLLLD